MIYLLTENGRVETTDYRTVKVPTGVLFVRMDSASPWKLRRSR